MHHGVVEQTACLAVQITEGSHDVIECQSMLFADIFLKMNSGSVVYPTSTVFHENFTNEGSSPLHQMQLQGPLQACCTTACTAYHTRAPCTSDAASETFASSLGSKLTALAAAWRHLLR